MWNSSIWIDGTKCWDLIKNKYGKHAIFHLHDMTFGIYFQIRWEFKGQFLNRRYRHSKVIVSAGHWAYWCLLDYLVSFRGCIGHLLCWPHMLWVCPRHCGSNPWSSIWLQLHLGSVLPPSTSVEPLTSWKCEDVNTLWALLSQRWAEAAEQFWGMSDMVAQRVPSATPSVINFIRDP